MSSKTGGSAGSTLPRGWPTQLFGPAIAGVALLALSGCGDGGLPFLGGSSAGDDDAAPQSVQLVARDVEAPDVFQITQAGVWDGAASLGGVWVSHPSVSEPGRAIIRNTANSTFVIGALLPDDTDAMPPALLISSDAADTLGMAADARSELEVTALRREETTAPASPDAVPIAAFDTPADIIETEIDDGAMEPVDAPSAAAPERSTLASLFAPRSNGSDLDRPFIQVGIFAVEENAQVAADRLRATGIIPTVLDQNSQGRRIWRVIIGPTTSADERAQLLAQINAQGFNDAFFVNN